MRVIIATIGKVKQRPEAALFEEYDKRLPWKITLKELEYKKECPAPERKAEETRLLLAACENAERLIALDEQGKEMTSVELAEMIKRWQSEGISSLGCIIGGSDGLDRAQLKPVHLKLAFGRQTWPHLLVRTMLIEQLYRAYTLITGHPYHRV